MQTAIRSSRQRSSSSPDPRALRNSTLKYFDSPRVLCIRARPGAGIPGEFDRLERGFLLTVDDAVAERAASRWPSWACYATASASIAPALAESLANHCTWDVLDIEAANPWPAVEGFFKAHRPIATKMAVIVDDGMRVKEEITRGGKKGAMYLSTCRDHVIEAAASVGLRLTGWAGFHTGGRAARTHFAAVLETAKRSASDSKHSQSRQIAESVAVHRSRQSR